MKNLTNLELSEQQIEKEIKREKQRCRNRAALRSAVFALLVVAAVAVLAAALWFPVLRITGNSMSSVLESGQAVLAFRTQELQRGDIVAMYYENKILVGRVVGCPGDWIDVDDRGLVSINGEEAADGYLEESVLEDRAHTYPYQVPDGCFYVMGDNRAESIDSRSSDIGCVSYDLIIGKIVFRLWPIDQLEYLG